jgi:hypothetical protein
MDRQGRSFIRNNNRIDEGERYCERCFKNRRITPLGSLTREEYVRAHFPSIADKLRVTRHEAPCPTCKKSAVVRTYNREVCDA